MGWLIAGAVLLLIVLILLIPLTARASWDGELRLELRWLFIKKTLYPAKKKQAETDKQEPKQEAEQKKKAPKKKQSVEELIEAVKEYIQRCGGGAKMILKDLRVSLLEINWTIAADDAAACAIRYGKMNAYLHGTLAAVDNLIRIKRANIHLTPDYRALEENFSAAADISLTPLIAIIGLVRVAWGVFMKMMSDSKNAKQRRSEQNERKEPRGTDGGISGQPERAD